MFSYLFESLLPRLFLLKSLDLYQLVVEAFYASVEVLSLLTYVSSFS